LEQEELLRDQLSGKAFMACVPVLKDIIYCEVRKLVFGKNIIFGLDLYGK